LYSHCSPLYRAYQKRVKYRVGKENIKGKLHPKTDHEGQKGNRGIALAIPLTTALDVSGWLMPRPDRFTPDKDPISILQEAGWAPGPAWRGTKYLAPTGIRSPDRPARSESLYRVLG
jgi:hypothetical protein